MAATALPLSGVHVSGVRVPVGETTERFPLQSTSNVFTYHRRARSRGRQRVARLVDRVRAPLANRGTNPITGTQAVPAEYVRDVISVMLTCATDDGAGQRLHDVGIPSKSGVSGHIVAAIPDRIVIAVCSPGLDAHGNSVRAVNICRDLSDHFGPHAFASPGRRAFS